MLNDDMLKNGKPFGKDYFDELLERIREIRASERRAYQKIMDMKKDNLFYSDCFGINDFTPRIYPFHKISNVRIDNLCYNKSSRACGKESVIMAYTTVEIRIPEAMKPFIVQDDSKEALLRNALLLYPFIKDKKISHGKAAEILGIHKLELIDMYGELGFSYFDQTMDELEQDMETFKALGLDKVVAV